MLAVPPAPYGMLCRFCRNMQVGYRPQIYICFFIVKIKIICNFKASKRYDLK